MSGQPHPVPRADLLKAIADVIAAELDRNNLPWTAMHANMVRSIGEALAARVIPENPRIKWACDPSLCHHCGNPARGYAAVGENRLCHPDEGMDCYVLVTVHGHPATALRRGPCPDCASPKGFPKLLVDRSGEHLDWREVTFATSDVGWHDGQCESEPGPVPGTSLPCGCAQRAEPSPKGADHG